jgi:hypothetical protein
MKERPPIVNVASAPTSLADDMEWSRQYAETNVASEGPAARVSERIVDSQLLPIPAQAVGVFAVRACEYVANVVQSIFKQR